MLLRKMILGAGRNTGGGDERPTGIGEPFQGGYYAGKMNYGVPGEDYWLIISDKADERTDLSWKTSNTSSTGTDSMFDGLVNTLAMNNDEHPAAKYCANLIVDGYDDWYLPARDEVELLYRNLKPTATQQIVKSRDPIVGGGPNGENLYSVPPGAAYETSNPLRTSIAAFMSPEGSQYLEPFVFSSTQGVGAGNTYGILQRTDTGEQTYDIKTRIGRSIRPVRRVKIPPIVPPTEFGQEFQGGFYAGKMKYADGEYWLVVAPKSTETSLVWETGTTQTTVATSMFDGLSNSQTLDSLHPAANYCTNLSVNGFDDWYLPARDELELCYRNLKPTTTANTTGNRATAVGGGPIGQNTNSVPTGSAYTTSSPAQTSSSLFKVGGSEQFPDVNSVFSSTEGVGSNMSALTHSFNAGGQVNASKTIARFVRAVRRVKV